jgi:putative membrane protein
MDLTEFIIRLILSAIAVFVTAKLLSGVKVSSFGQSILVAVLLGIINALMIMLVDKLLKGFAVKSFWWAFFFSIILSILNGFLQWLY